MNLLSVLIALTVPAADLPAMDGNRITPGEACYAIVANGRTLGATRQTIRAGDVDGRAVWDIVVHQKVDGFDLSDHFVVDRATLLPLSLDSRRGADRSARGWHEVKLEYSADRVTGTRTNANGEVAIDEPLSGPTWDGNLWGVTFAALPLEAGKSFEIPFWQYDKSHGSFLVDVVSEEMVDTPDGPVKAWIVNAGTERARMTRYRIASDDRRELGYSAGAMEQRLGGDCTAIDAARGA